MTHCCYCGKAMDAPNPIVVGKDREVVSCCSDACAERTRRFYGFVDRTLPLFWIGIILSTGMVMAGSLFSATGKAAGLTSLLAGCGLGLMGLVSILFPFGTPECFQWVGIRRTVWAVRALGALTMGFGVVVYELL